LGGEVLFGEGDLLALAGEEEVFEFPIGEEGFDFGSKEELIGLVFGLLGLQLRRLLVFLGLWF
jgi:hypothetical protein